MSAPLASHVRRNTNIEMDAETTPFAHRYLFKRPVVKEHLASSYDSSLNLQHARSSHTGFTIPGEENESGEGINNPMVEKRRFELFIDLIWVGIIGNIVSESPRESYTSGLLHVYYVSPAAEYLESCHLLVEEQLQGPGLPKKETC